MVKLRCSNFRVITVKFLDVRIFRIFTVDHYCTIINGQVQNFISLKVKTQNL